MPFCNCISDCRTAMSSCHMRSEDQSPEPKRTGDTQPLRLSEEQMAALANHVAKSFKAKELKVIANHVAKTLKPEHYWQIGKSLRSSWVFWIVVGASACAVCFTAWKAVPHFVKEKAKTVWDAELTKRIKEEFQEPRISNVVVAVASTEATNILKQEIAPQIRDFETELIDNLNKATTNVNESLKSFVIGLGTTMDPSNQPIRSIVASARFTLRGNPTNTIKGYKDPVDHNFQVCMLSFGRYQEALTNLYRISLIADRFTMYSAEKETGIYMDFHINPLLPQSPGERAALVDEMDVVLLSPIFLAPNPDILEGIVTLTINSIICKEFPIPPQEPVRSDITCQLTNGSVATFELGRGGKRVIIPYPSRIYQPGIKIFR
jgi:hypothetical protein